MAQQRDTTRFFGRKNLIGALITAAFAVSFFIPTPYYLYSPGSAEELAPKVTIENGQKDEKGNLMLTTVLSMQASNIYYLAYGYVAPHTEIRKEAEVKGDLSDREYDRLLKHMMDSSQHNAIINGYRAANEPFTIHYQGVFVNGFSKGSKAKGVLEVGDLIQEVDGHKVQQTDDMVKYLNGNKKSGDTVEVKVERDDALLTKTLEVMALDSDRVGIGVAPENEITLETPRKVDIHAEDIGGPSAGLMFSLEIYSQLTPGDLTKGYQIAGTGQITLDGKVKQIGGIRHKIVAADEKGADIFFAPADVNQETDANYRDAADEAKVIGSKMKIVPIATMQEAIDYLKELPEKK